MPTNLERYHAIAERLGAATWDGLFDWDVGPILSRNGITLRLSPKIFDFNEDDALVAMAEREFARAASDT